jgi:hypothetical protein
MRQDDLGQSDEGDEKENQEELFNRSDILKNLKGACINGKDPA